MAIRAIWGFDHLPQLKTFGTRANCYGLFYAGYSLSRVVLDAAASDILLDGGGISCVYGSATPSTAVFKFELGPTTDGISVRSHIAFTITRRTNATTLGNAVIASLGGTVPLVYANEYPNVVDVPVQVELTVDRVDKKIIVYVNNKIVRIIKNATAVDSWNTNHIQCGLTNSIVRSMAIHFKDFIFIDDTQDDTPCIRPGQSVVVNNPLTEAFANWTTNAASVGASITTPLTNDLTTPVAQSLPDAPSALSFKINSAVSSNYDIKAITFIATMNKIQATPTKLKVAGDLNNTNTVINNARLSGTATPSVSIALFTRFNNTPLAQINTVNFSLTPVTA